MFGFGKKREFRRKLVELARIAREPALLERGVAKLAESDSRRKLSYVPSLLHDVPKYDGRGDFTEACDWIWDWQTAIFAFCYKCYPDSKAFIEGIAFGGYDWSQAIATETLCRIALEGRDTASIAERIAKELPTWRYEQQMRVVGALARLSTRSEKLRKAVEQLIEVMKDDDVVDALEMVKACHLADAGWSAQYAPFVREVMRGAGLEGRSAIDDGAVVSVPEGESLEDVFQRERPDPRIARAHQTDAALLLLKMHPLDAEAREYLREECGRCEDSEVRQELAKVLSEHINVS